MTHMKTVERMFILGSECLVRGSCLIVSNQILQPIRRFDFNMATKRSPAPLYQAGGRSFACFPVLGCLLAYAPFTFHPIDEGSSVILANAPHLCSSHTLRARTCRSQFCRYLHPPSRSQLLNSKLPFSKYLLPLQFPPKCPAPDLFWWVTRLTCPMLRGRKLLQVVECCRAWVQNGDNMLWSHDQVEGGARYSAELWQLIA